MVNTRIEEAKIVGFEKAPPQEIIPQTNSWEGIRMERCFY